MSLRKQAVSGMIWTFLQQFGSQLISFVVSLVLARLLLPEEFGLIGMLTIFMGIGSALFNGGLTSSLIRTQECTQEDYSTVFYFNFAGSILIYGILFMVAPWIAKFYHQPSLTSITRVYGLTFILSAFGTVQNTILTRELKFKKLAIISLPALVISSVVGILMAYLNYGVWSLIASTLVNVFFVSFFLWFNAKWYPKLIFSKDKFIQHFYYGYKLTISAILDTIFTNIYHIVIGRFYSPTLVGYYTRANTLMMLPVGNISGALNKVVFPLFSKVQDDLPRFRNSYKQIMQMVLFIITPIIVLMGLLAKPLIVFLFTDKWLAVVPIFKIICFTGILYPIHLYNLIVLEVKGRSDLFLKLEVLKKILLTIILIISFFYGFYALLWGQLIFSILALFINTHYAGKILEYSMWQQMRDILPIFIFAVIMAAITFIVDRMLTSQIDIVRLILGSLSGSLTYLLVAYMFKFESIQDIKNLILKI
ncbi:lipopolysaccharide biosynthesis protein [Flavobacterium tyrosinilyticum]|uniref:lipopolysaccharide biosynthesis protein n=1 Tax=Flavobacterium tyrosinilyticum TaxID=1658740 RepID=UPI00202E50B1|nr:lipopolysaccharide biosynthesis protein [Flavobacterium tyrosinilyticum]MCM0668679.1 lipopolysaccharide biosynthesis protein [Flavobacterium tyrosinilyticum]